MLIFDAETKFGFGMFVRALSILMLCLLSGRAAAIPNGSVDTDDRFPFVLQLLTGDGGTCSGVLIHPKVVLTNAHCFMRQDKAIDPLVPLREIRGVMAGKGWVHRSAQYVLMPDRFRKFVNDSAAESMENRANSRRLGQYEMRNTPFGHMTVPIQYLDFAVVVLESPITHVGVAKTIFDFTSLERIIESVDHREGVPWKTETRAEYLNVFVELIPKGFEWGDMGSIGLSESNSVFTVGYGVTDEAKCTTLKCIDGNRRIAVGRITTWDACKISSGFLLFGWCGLGYQVAKGDSGGAMLLNYEGQPIVTGLIAWGGPEGGRSMSIFPSLFLMADWIHRGLTLATSGELLFRDKKGQLVKGGRWPSVAQNSSEELKASQSVSAPDQRGWLGVKIHNVTDEISTNLGLKEAIGAVISEVTQSGPASKADIRVNDVVLEFNGGVIDSSMALAKGVADAGVGSQVTLLIYRAGKFIETTVILSERPEVAAEKVERDRREKYLRPASPPGPVSSSPGKSSAPTAELPSWCDTPQSHTEATICDTSELLELNRRLETAYRPLRNLSEVRSAQRDWIKRRASCGTNIECIREAYVQRIQQLNQ
ncbi:PDZ domain-containing protein [Leptospira interrogans]